MFGRSPRDTGLTSERNNDPTAAQQLHLLNSSHIQRKIERSRKLRRVLRSAKEPRKAATSLYLMTLSRYPTPDELRVVASYLRARPNDGRTAVVDVVWALINTPEFLYRH